MLRIGFIGSGTMGAALALSLAKRDYHVRVVSSRSGTAAEKLARAVPGCKAAYDNQVVADNADLVFITTPDDVIGRIAGEVKWKPGQRVVHCSGADSTAILEPARQAGAAVGCFHPLQTFASVQWALENIPGSTVAIEAEEPLFPKLKEMASALGCHSIVLHGDNKVLYHAAAVITSNYLVTLVTMAVSLWETIGLSQEEALRALLPLLKGTVNNIEAVGLPECLTGPIARGDTGTIKKHLDSLEKAAPELLSVYRELALKTIPVALAKGKTSKRQDEALRAVLEKEPGRPSSGIAQDRARDRFSRI